MKYFTKEWYELCQKTSAHLLLKEDKGAEFFSEEFFQKLYKEKLREWLVIQEEVSKILLESQVDEAINISYPPFDRDKSSEEFYKAFTSKKEHIINILPQEVLKKIADIRVFVLNVASSQVVKDVTEFCEENQKEVKMITNEYKKYYKKEMKSLDNNIVENFKFHDCTIVDIKETKQSLSILLDNSGGFTDIEEIKFENYKIIKQDSLLKGSWWLYDEIYRKDDKYELHVLLHNKNRNLVEFIISAENISFNANIV